MRGKLRDSRKCHSCYWFTPNLVGESQEKWSIQPKCLNTTHLVCFLAKMGLAIPKFFLIVLCLCKFFLSFKNNYCPFFSSVSEQRYEIFLLSVNSRVASTVLLCMLYHKAETHLASRLWILTGSGARVFQTSEFYVENNCLEGNSPPEWTNSLSGFTFPWVTFEFIKCSEILWSKFGAQKCQRHVGWSFSLKGFIWGGFLFTFLLWIAGENQVSQFVFTVSRNLVKTLMRLVVLLVSSC